MSPSIISRATDHSALSLFAYGLANEWVRPQYAGYTGYIVSARSAHGFWLRRQIPFEISSEDDESPQYRPSGNEKDSAREVGMSRTTFAERFKSLAGSAPLEYLTRWRMTIARNALRRDDSNLAAIAETIGYESETAFSSAFKRMFGCSSGFYRTRLSRSAL